MANIFWPFSHWNYHWKLKWPARYRLWVYKFETFLGGSQYQSATALQRGKPKSKLLFFWPRLMFISHFLPVPLLPPPPDCNWVREAGSTTSTPETIITPEFSSKYLKKRPTKADTFLDWISHGPSGFGSRDQHTSKMYHKVKIKPKNRGKGIFDRHPSTLLKLLLQPSP